MYCFTLPNVMVNIFITDNILLTMTATNYLHVILRTFHHFLEKTEHSGNRKNHLSKGFRSKLFLHFYTYSLIFKKWNQTWQITMRSHPNNFGVVLFGCWWCCRYCCCCFLWLLYLSSTMPLMLILFFGNIKCWSTKAPCEGSWVWVGWVVG